MIDISKWSTSGWEAAIRGMRNPLNSWDKSDSIWPSDEWPLYSEENVYTFNKDVGGMLGEADLKLMNRLALAGSDHAKYRRMITVYCDILAPLYWWKEMDTYKVGTVANSCSTMHTITNKEFTVDDFSHEHLIDKIQNSIEDDPESVVIEMQETYPKEILLDICMILNHYRNLYLKTKDKKYWWQIIQLLPSSYNQKRTLMLNYENLARIYAARKDHKLDEWHIFCEWIEKLPYAKEIIFPRKKEE
jgi:hypothetical protein